MLLNFFDSKSPLRVLLCGLFRASRSCSLTSLICQLSFAISMFFSILSRPGFLDSSAQFPFIDHFPALVPLSLVLFPLPLLLLDFSSIFFHPRWKTAMWGSSSASNFKQLYIPTTPGFLWWIPLANIEIMRRKEALIYFLLGGWLRLALLSLNLNKTTDLISPSIHEYLLNYFSTHSRLLWIELKIVCWHGGG